MSADIERWISVLSISVAIFPVQTSTTGIEDTTT